MTLNIVRPKHPKFVLFSNDFSECLERGVVTNDGPHVRKFEDALTNYLGVETIAFSSGQAALMTMLAACNITHGGVICPSFTFCATPHAIRWTGGYPIFADIKEDLTLDMMDVERKMTKATRAVLMVDPYGIISAGSNHKLWQRKDGSMIPILSDSAPSFGFEPRTHTFANIYSFHATKPFSTMEGGALSSSDPNFIDLCKRIRNFGQDADGDCEVAGLNGKMMEVCALIGLRQLDTWQETSDRRRVAADALAANLQGIPGLKVVEAPPTQRPIWIYRPILITEEFGMSRDAVILALKRFDIHVRKYYTACHQLSVYRHMNVSLPVTERIASQIIALPVYSDMKMSEIERIGSALRNLQGGGGY